MNGRPVALVPVNRLERAKGRLADVLAPHERSALALATLGTVVSAAAAAGCEVVVLTADEAVARRYAGDERVQVMLEREDADGLNGQLEAAISAIVAARGEAAPVLVLHADLPLATGPAVTALVEAAPAPPSVTLVRSGDGGTNAMLLWRAPGMRLHYGPGSFARHVAAAEVARLAARHVRAPELELDLDTEADLRAFVARNGSGETPAGRALASSGAVARLRGGGTAGARAESEGVKGERGL